jgi:coenzyme Q-binding protein COQ10
VADVDSYHHFIPFCTSSRVLKASVPDWKARVNNDGDPPVHLEAELKGGFLGMDESYTSKVECRPFESVQVIHVYQLDDFVLNLL